jgi:hypothetical protein
VVRTIPAKWVTRKYAKAIRPGNHGLIGSAALEIIAATLVRIFAAKTALETYTSIPP